MTLEDYKKNITDIVEKCNAANIKVMILTAYLRRGDVRNRDLSGDERYNLERMIEWSDDSATWRVFGHVHCSGLDKLARTVGMRHFESCGPNHDHWGRSRIDSDDQSLFLLNLQDQKLGMCMLAARHQLTSRS